MAITVSDGLKAAAVSSLGNVPVGKIEVYPVSGHTSTSKGLSRTIFDMYDRYADGQIPDRDTLYEQDTDKVIWPPDGVTDYCPLVAFNWGDAPPLGISPVQLEDGCTWGMKLDGYFHFTLPEGYTGNVNYTFGYVSTGFAGIAIGKKMQNADILGSSPHSIMELDTAISISTDAWAPITMFYARRNDNGTTRQRKDERFVAFWKDDIDDEWRVIGADRTCPVGGRFKNLVGTAMEYFYADKRCLDVTYILTIHEDAAGYWWIDINGGSNAYEIFPGSTQSYDFADVGHSGKVIITWADDISDGDKVEISLVRGVETPWILPAVQSFNIDHSMEAASTLKFTVPITISAFDEAAVDSTNAYTYDLSTDSFGVLRKGRHIRAYMGYKVDGMPEYVRRFTGIIQDIRPSHSSSSDGAPSIMLDITCLDARSLALNPPVKKIEDLPFGPLPNALSYDLAQYFPDDLVVGEPDGIRRPEAYDRWNLAKMMRTVLIQNNFMSDQLWAKDDNGNFLIEDRGLAIEANRTYPYNWISPLGASTSVRNQKRWLGYGDFNDYRSLYGYASVSPNMIGINALAKNLLYNAWVTDTVLTEHAGAVEDVPFLYQFSLDSDPWGGLVELFKGFGLDFGVNVDGNVYLRYPNNPVIYSSEATTTGDNTISYDSNWTRTEDSKAIGNVRYVSNIANAHITVKFTGVGIKLIFPRTKASGWVRVSLDKTGERVTVNGINILDDATGDTGHNDWLDYMDETGRVALQLSGRETDPTYWYYADGVYPPTGENPTVFTICDNLTYGEHVLHIYNAGGLVLLEGFMPIVKSIEYPRHEFDAAVDIISIESDESIDDMVNDIVVIGNQSGAMGNYVTSRAVDLGSITAEGTSNFVGRRLSWLISDPKLINQDRANYLASHSINRYGHGRRSPSIASVGLPWLETGDAITISDTRAITDGRLPVAGFYAPDDLDKRQRTGITYGNVIQPVPFQRYWITEISEQYNFSNASPEYVCTVRPTSFKPLPAYEPVPEPDQDQFTTPIENTKVFIDDYLMNYNPFLSDAQGKYVHIDFDLTWHARLLRVEIIVGDNLIEYSGEKKPLHLNDVVNTLLLREGFIPAGKIELTWDGWLDEGDGKGHFVPDGNYAVRVTTERYSTGAFFSTRMDGDMVSMAGGSLRYIRVASSRLSAYGTSVPFSVSISPTGTLANPTTIYDLETNDGRGVQINAVLQAPAQVMIKLAARQLYSWGTPSNEAKERYSTTKYEWDFELMGEEGPLLEPGSYVFYFNPVAHLTREGVKQNFIGMTDATGQLWDNRFSYWVCWHFWFKYGIQFRDKSADDIIDAALTRPVANSYFCWGGPRSATYPTSVLVHDNKFYYRFFRVREAT